MLSEFWCMAVLAKAGFICSYPGLKTVAIDDVCSSDWP